MNVQTPVKPFSRNQLASGLDRVFKPKSVAVIGAFPTFGKWAQLILTNIVTGGFQGKIFPVNPKEKVMCGPPVHSRIQDIPEPVDLAFITTPAKTVPAIPEACGGKGIRGVVLITSGFGDTDGAGTRSPFQS